MSRFPIAALGTALLCLLAVVLTALPARAWIETAVRRHETKITVAEDGTAEVRHELVLRIRGSKMRALEIPGISGPLEVLPDAMVRSARQGSASLWPLTLSTSEEGTLRLTLQSERGVGGGTYRFEFGYKLDLKQRGLIESVGADYRVTFVGPRLSTGVDSAKVTFKVPRGSVEPRLDESEEGPSAGVLLGQVRRGLESDEIELIRAYVAKREPAVWRILLPEDALPGVGLAEVQPRPERQLVVARRKLASEFLPLSHLAILLGLASLFGLLSGLKTRIARRRADAVDAVVRPFLPGGPLVRAGMAFAAAFGFGVLVLLQRPAWSVAPAVVCLALSTHLLPTRRVRPRGPGRWESIDEAITKDVVPASDQWFEIGSIRGFLLLLGLLSAVLYGAFRLLPIDSYLSLMSVVYGLLFLPLFLTGRRADLPQGPVAQVLPYLSGVRHAFDSSLVRFELWGRVPVGETLSWMVDEARIRILPGRAPKGLRALEVAFDEGPGSFVVPCVVVRVIDGSDAQLRLPADVPWRRGRDADERVALLRPTTPTLGQLVRLVKSLVQNFRAPVASSAQSDRRSSGKGLSTPKVAPEGPTAVI